MCSAWFLDIRIINLLRYYNVRNVNNGEVNDIIRYVNMYVATYNYNRSDVRTCDSN